MSETFEGFIGAERLRLDAEHADVTAQMRALQTRLNSIQNERVAITAYENAKNGKSAPSHIRGGGAPRAARKGSRREELLTIIRTHGGISRGELLDKMGLKGNKAGEMSVSNALTALTKIEAVKRDGGKYSIGG